MSLFVKKNQNIGVYDIFCVFIDVNDEKKNFLFDVYRKRILLVLSRF